MTPPARLVLAVIGEDWPQQWPCASLRPGDAILATFATNGDLIGLQGSDHARDGEAAELDAALERYGRCRNPSHVEVMDAAIFTTRCRNCGATV